MYLPGGQGIALGEPLGQYPPLGQETEALDEAVAPRLFVAAPEQ